MEKFIKELTATPTNKVTAVSTKASVYGESAKLGLFSANLQQTFRSQSSTKIVGGLAKRSITNETSTFQVSAFEEYLDAGITPEGVNQLLESMPHCYLQTKYSFAPMLTPSQQADLARNIEGHQTLDDYALKQVSRVGEKLVPRVIEGKIVYRTQIFVPNEKGAKPVYNVFVKSAPYLCASLLEEAGLSALDAI